VVTLPDVLGSLEFRSTVLFLQRSCLCNSGAYATVALMQQWRLCNSGAYATVALMQDYNLTNGEASDIIPKCISLVSDQ
jgi:hypothetical protein